MKEERARDNIRACIALAGDCDHQGHKCHEYEKGYLEAIEKAKGLEEALELLRDGHTIRADITDYRVIAELVSKEALANYEATK